LFRASELGTILEFFSNGSSAGSRKIAACCTLRDGMPLQWRPSSVRG
jgi:hypothetical protein